MTHSIILQGSLTYNADTHCLILVLAMASSNSLKTSFNEISQMRKIGIWGFPIHYNDDMMSAIASQITSLTIVYSTVYSGADQRKHQSSASLAVVRGIHWWSVNSPHKGPVTRKIFPFDDVIVILALRSRSSTIGHSLSSGYPCVDPCVYICYRKLYINVM